MAGWRVFGTSARPSGKSEKGTCGTCGGVMAIVPPVCTSGLSRLSTSLRGLTPRLASGWTGWPTG
eukprot:13049512-Alexandrium_andersonii.AAC.1